jgi:DNA-binding MarR family transcriptional regulator
MTLKVLQIATLGDDEEPIYVGIREYPVSKLVLIHEPEQRFRAADIAARLEGLRIPVDRREVQNPARDMYEVISSILKEERDRYDDIYINVSSGRKLMTCSAISAAFVNGLKAFHVEGDTPMMLPVLKFSYSEVISPSKISILRALDRMGGVADSLTELSSTSGVEKSLLSYHLRGGRGSRGLEELGLVEIDRGTQGKLLIKLTEMGRLLLIGSPEG